MFAWNIANTCHAVVPFVGKERWLAIDGDRSAGYAQDPTSSANTDLVTVHRAFVPVT